GHARSQAPGRPAGVRDARRSPRRPDLLACRRQRRFERRTGRRGPSVAPSASPKPAGIDFTAERARHARFVGRAALLAQLDQLLVDEPSDRWVVVTGGPGMGKSALLAQWLAKREAADDPVPHHFIRRG